MPAFCAVQNCGDKYGHADNISFHKFPFKRQELLKKWLDFAQRGPDWQPSKWSAICSRHFRDEDFKCSGGRKILKKTAVPCVQVVKQGTENINVQMQQNEDNSKTKLLEQTKQDNVVATAERLAETGGELEEEEENINESLLNSPTAPKIKCRLCGSACSAVVTFSTNFEIYGMIQKCFPTLNIQKDDHLPKEMCRLCLKRLESFSRFVDKVLETQSELQRKYRTEKANSSTRPVERQLKVKQEPVVRVKQEIAEGIESFLSDDLDMGMDEGCEQEHDADTNVEQKYDFCDFPMLNAQDIINNCDIMEIINLDDPFINIPDDDANTNCENGTEGQQMQDQTKQQREREKSKKGLQSAHDLLQAHLLNEEHNYAYTTEDMKEEWQLKNIYKTEKTEGGEYGDGEEFVTNAEQEDDEQVGYVGDEQHHGECEDSPIMYKENFPITNGMQTTNAHTDKITTNKALSHAPTAETRSTRPIVTSVSDFADASLALSNGSGRDAINNEKLMVTAVNRIPVPTTNASEVPTTTNSSSTSSVARKIHAKPNIVVLNESIVKSSSVFQLHTCHCCHLKFFSIESLNQHNNIAHNAQTQALEQESQARPGPQKLQSAHPQQQQQQQQQQHQQPQDPYNQQQQNMLAQTNHYQQQQQQQQQHHHLQQQQTHHHQQQGQLPMVSMPADFLWKPYGAANDTRRDGCNHNCKIEKEFAMPTMRADRTHKADDAITYQQPNMFGQPFEYAHSNPTRNTFIESIGNAGEETLLGAPNVVRILEMKRTFLRQHEPYNSSDNVPPANSNDLEKAENFCAANASRMENQFNSRPHPIRRHKQRLNTNSTVIARLNALERKITAAVSPDLIAVEYRRLRRRYAFLKRKCKSLSAQVQGQRASDGPIVNAPTQRLKQQSIQNAHSRFRCRICLARFKSIYHLLRHKRARSHWSRRRPSKHFATTCCGCEKFFRHKIALRNHMRYICQALPLCWFKLQMQTFKCRCCRRITFNHWRLYRRHEVKCKLAKQRKKLTIDPQSRQRRSANSKQRTTKARVVASNVSAARRTPSAMALPATSKQKHPKVTTREYSCSVCAKVFTSANSLSQHNITHTDQRRHKCRLCARAFKRRNGLTQHVRGFHLQLKPHKCVVCQRSYALKSDMLRCRHAAVKRATNTAMPMKNDAPLVESAGGRSKKVAAIKK